MHSQADVPVNGVAERLVVITVKRYSSLRLWHRSLPIVSFDREASMRSTKRVRGAKSALEQSAIVISRRKLVFGGEACLTLVALPGTLKAATRSRNASTKDE